MAEFIKGVQFGGNYSFPMMSVNSPLLRINSLLPVLDFSKDGGNFTASVGSVTEIQSSGFYTLNVINSTEMDAETISIIASAEGAVSWQDIIYTKGFSATDIKSDTAAILEDTDALNNLSATDVNSEVQAVFNTVIPAGPTSGSPYGMLVDTFDGTATITSRLTAARAGYLDNLNIGENVAGVSDISGLNDLSAAQVRSECTAAVEAYDAVVPGDLPANFSDLTIISGTGRTVVASNYDKTGYTVFGQVDITNSATDLIWTRPFSHYEDAASERSPYWAMAKLVNKIDFSGASVQIKKVDDTTNLFTQTASSDATANPIVALDTN
jgi:hypothetical protein